ncbi:MAG: hypothetical protein ACM3X0_02625 [Bacteroidota bacterium]
MLQIEQLKSISETGRNATRRLTEVGLDGQEKMVRVNLDAIQEFINTSNEGLKDSYSDLAHGHPVEAWPKVIMGSIQRSTALNLNLIDISRRLQQEMASTVDEHLRALRDGTIDAIEQCVAVARNPQGGRRSKSKEVMQEPKQS